MADIEDLERAIRPPDAIERFEPVGQSKVRRPGEPRPVTIVATHSGDKEVLGNHPGFKKIKHKRVKR